MEMGCGERPAGKVDETVVERRRDGMWGTTSRQGGCRDLLDVEDQTKTQDLIMHRISLCTQSKSPTGWGFTVEQTADSHTPSDTIRQRMTHHQTEDDTPSDRG